MAAFKQSDGVFRRRIESRIAELRRQGEESRARNLENYLKLIDEALEVA